MPECIILSPGPGRPEDAGVLIDVIKNNGEENPRFLAYALDIRQYVRHMVQK